MEMLEDIGRIRDVLRANACDKQVGDDMLVALLELYASDQQRVDLVVLELEEMLGRPLAVNAQQARWQELQQETKKSFQDIEVMYENVSTQGNEEVSVTAILTVPQEKRVNPFPLEKDTDLPGPTCQTFPVNERPERNDSSQSGKVLATGVGDVATIVARAAEGKTHRRDSKNEPYCHGGVMLQRAPLQRQPNPLPSSSRTPTIFPLPSVRISAHNAPNGFANPHLLSAAFLPPQSDRAIGLSHVIPANNRVPPNAAAERIIHPVNPRKRPAADPLMDAPSTSRHSPSTSTNAARISQVMSSALTCTAQGTPTSNSHYKGTPTCFRDYVSVKRKNGECASLCSTSSSESSSLFSVRGSSSSAKSESPTGPDLKEQRAIDLFQSLMDRMPDMHIHYAAFIAAETALLSSTAEDASRLGNMPNVRYSDAWTLPRFMSDDHESVYRHTVDHYLKVQLDFMIMALPEADPEYLEDLIKPTGGNQDRIRNLLDGLMENGGYPSRADYNKRKEYEELSKKFFSAEEFLEMYDDPFKYFYDQSRPTKLSYQDEAMNQLKADFRSTSVNILRRVFRDHEFHYVPSHYELMRSPELHCLKSKRSLRECRRHKTKDLQLLQELAFIRNEEQIYDYLRNKEQLRSEALSQARANNMLLECPICCENEFLDEDFAKCEQGHGICCECVRRQSEELIGQMKNHVRCLHPECTAEYALATLRKVLGKSVYLRLEKRRQAEEVIAAGIEGLESCPFCEYCEVPNEADRLFRCQNPECGKVSCRQCRESDHSPLRCEEYAVRMRLQNYVESKMTDALLRECPACKRKFVKADGCNKMVCVCGAIMCYICRKQIKDYSHFAPLPALGAAPPDHGNPASAKCPLYSDTEKMHEEEVARSAAVARAELIAQNPNIRVDLVLGKGKALQSR